jgi:hypothetical protein
MDNSKKKPAARDDLPSLLMEAIETWKKTGKLPDGRRWVPSVDNPSKKKKVVDNGR